MYHVSPDSKMFKPNRVLSKQGAVQDLYEKSLGKVSLLKFVFEPILLRRDFSKH